MSKWVVWLVVVIGMAWVNGVAAQDPQEVGKEKGLVAYWSFDEGTGATAKDSAGNRILSDAIEQSTEAVQRGESLAAELGRSGLFPPDIVDMIAVAEESNNLETVLVQIADSNEARTSRQVDIGVRLLEPLLLMGMAAIVLVIAVALLVPILRMSSAMA